MAGQRTCSAACDFANASCTPNPGSAWRVGGNDPAFKHSCGTADGPREVDFWRVDDGIGPCEAARASGITLPRGHYRVVFDVYGDYENLRVLLDVTRSGNRCGAGTGGLCPTEVLAYNDSSEVHLAYEFDVTVDCASDWTIGIRKQTAAAELLIYNISLQVMR